MLMQVRESAQGLVLAYPLWLGLLVLVMGIALGIHLARARWDTKKHTGPAIAALFLMCAGVYWLTYRVTFTAQGARAYVFLYRDDRIDWSQVSGVTLEQREGGRGTRTYLVLQTTSGTQVDINVSGLSATDEQRVKSYIASKVTAR